MSTSSLIVAKQAIKTPRGRFAPSPTGRLHLGNARTALLAWLQMRVQGGMFILRIEDLDPSRVRSDAEAAILHDLEWLGLDWDEGPDVGGAFGPYRQSERTALYETFMQQLETYPCTCTRREILELIHAAPNAPHAREPRYPGTCRTRPPLAGRATAWRLKVPNGIYGAMDLIGGFVSEDVGLEVGDFVLRRNDGAFAYQLAVVVDDLSMGITDVLRGEDLLSSLPRQALQYTLFGAKPPRFCHVPLLQDAQGERLAKRDRSQTLETLRTAGTNPQAVVAQLAQSLGWKVANTARPAELLEPFNIWLEEKAKATAEQGR